MENGADAVYFGLRSGLNARARAVNFAPDELPELMGHLHRRGVKGYVTLNTLVFQSELDALELAARQAIAAGVDAVLVQDLGAARLIHAVCPDWPMHASTQMSLTSAEGIGVAESLGLRAGGAGPGAVARRKSARSAAARGWAWRSSSTARCASPCRASAWPASPWAAAAPTAASVPRPAGCPTS